MMSQQLKIEREYLPTMTLIAVRIENKAFVYGSSDSSVNTANHSGCITLDLDTLEDLLPPLNLWSMYFKPQINSNECNIFLRVHRPIRVKFKFLPIWLLIKLDI